MIVPFTATPLSRWGEYASDKLAARDCRHCHGRCGGDVFLFMQTMMPRSNDPVALMQTVGQVSGVVGALGLVMLIFGLIGKKFPWRNRFGTRHTRHVCPHPRWLCYSAKIKRCKKIRENADGFAGW
jgi:hypothetical protein